MSVGTETLDLVVALGRVLAAPVDAPHPVPNHTNAAVDGYAYAASDYDRAKGATLPVAGRSAAGTPFSEQVSRGAAVRILTGAVLPGGVDSVAMQEDCTLDAASGGAQTVTLPAGLKPGANVRMAGEDVAAGHRLFDPGHIVRPQDLAALASVGQAKVACFERLKVAIVSTGDEVLRAGAGALPTGKVFDANAPMLAGLVGLAGARPTDLGIWPDNAQDVTRRLAEAARGYDVVITSGGASRGEEDHIAAALGQLGRRHFWQIGIKPGRPMMLGQIGKTLVIGLPGNPVAVFVCFLMYVYPLLRRLGGAPWHEPRRLMLPARFAFPDRKTGRREFWRGSIIDTAQGLAVDKFARDGSGLITSLRVANCLIDIPEDVPEVRQGQPVAVIPFSEFGIVGS